MDDQVKVHRHPIWNGIASAFRGLQLLLVQCSICIVVVLLLFGLRLVGNDLFNSVAALFREAMLDDNLISAVSSAFNTPTVSAMAHTNERLVVAPFEGGIITSAFGERDGALHEGMDIAIDEGTPLKAMLDGTVTVAEYDEKGYGHYLVVTCSENEKFLYAHCQRLTVKTGDAVKAGDIVAFVGNTGRSSGSHLHVEWICNGHTVDPLQILPESTYV